MLSRQMVFSIIGAFILAGAAFGIKERRYYSWNEDCGKTFIGTGVIVDISSQGKYIFEIEKKEYLLYAEKEYAIGDQLRLVGNIQNNIHSDWFSYRTISTWTFAVPLFSWGFDYPKRLKMKGRQGTIYEKNSIRIDVIPAKAGIHTKQTGFPIRSGMTWESAKSGMTWESVKSEMMLPQSNPSVWIIQSMKKSIQEKVIEAYGENKISGLILWMLIGDKSQIPEAEYQQFVDSGLVHLIAVSGWNILMIVVFLQCVLFFLPFYVRIGLILVTITGYSLICGMDSSVFRALLMGGLSMVALFRGREIDIRRLLSISALVMLVINPYFLAYDTGFLLSYSALIGIVYFDTIKRSNDETTKWQINRFQKWLQYIYKTYISPSIWASIGIFPIIIFFMGQMNLLSIIGNLLVLPIVPFVMIYGFASTYAYALLDRQRLLWIEKLLVQYIYKISEFLSTYGLYISVTGLWVKYLFLVWFLIWFVLRRIKSNKNTGANSKNSQ